MAFAGAARGEGAVVGHVDADLHIDVQVCVDVADNGALSSCSAGEGHTWGKTSIECVESRSVYCRTDVTVALPLLTQALLSDRKLRRKPMRLYDELPAAIADLDARWRK